MADCKKADRNRKSRSNLAYLAGNRRAVNQTKRVKRHLRHFPNDHKAKRWLHFLETTVSVDIKRGSPVVAKAFATIHRTASS